MKTGSIILSVCFLALCFITGCSDYERKGVVTPEITVNTQSLSLFVGGTEQLKASPVGLSFSWTSEDEEVATVDGAGLVTATGEGNTFIVVRSGDMTCRLPVSVVVKIPMTGFRLSVTEMELNPKARRSVVVILEPENANDASHPVWSSRNTDVATVDYKGEITGVGVGVVDIACTINGIVKTVSVDVWLTKPFKGPHIISAAEPFILKAADFDIGGEGNAFHDTNTGANQAGQTGTNYRINNGDSNSGSVGIQSDQESIGYTSDGEWLIYTIEVQDAGEYYLSLDAAVNATSRYRIELLEGEHIGGDFSNWRNMTGTVTVSQTGGWSNWAWLDIANPVTLPAGTQKIRYYFETAALNFRNLKFTHSDLYNPPPDPVDVVSEILTGETGKNWKIGSWTSMRNPDNRNEVWWDFKDPAIMDDIFTFNADGSFIHENNGNSFMNESMGDLFPDGDTGGSFVTEHYTPPTDASWEVSKIDGKLILTINKGFFGYATSSGDLVETQYLVSEYSDTSIRLILNDGWGGWCFEIVPAD